jgi:regulator of cell morphogenesis and NO signaling
MTDAAPIRDAAAPTRHIETRHHARHRRRPPRLVKLAEGACTPWAMLYAGLAEFMADLTEHIRLENDALFPRFERNLRVPSAS